MKENDYKIIIDLHRDSIKRNLSVYENNNKKYAKILFVLTKKRRPFQDVFFDYYSLIKNCNRLCTLTSEVP